MIDTTHHCDEWFRGFDGRYRCVECQQETRPGTAGGEKAMNDTVRKALQEARDYALADQQRGAKLLEQGREAVANLERAMADTQQRIADLNAALSGEVA